MSEITPAAVVVTTPKPEGVKSSVWRKKFGKCGGALVGTKVLSKDLEHFNDAKPGSRNYSCLVINEEAGIYTQCNIYDGKFGKNYDPARYTHELTEERSKKWKGYEEADPEELGIQDLVVLIDDE